jgi:hypothetical protein
MFIRLQSRIGTLWCSLVHESVTWPIHSEFECRSCGRRYAAFAEPPIANSAVSRSPQSRANARSATASLSRA